MILITSGFIIFFLLLRIIFKLLSWKFFLEVPLFSISLFLILFWFCNLLFSFLNHNYSITAYTGYVQWFIITVQLKNTRKCKEVLTNQNPANNSALHDRHTVGSILHMSYMYYSFISLVACFSCCRLKSVRFSLCWTRY